MSPKERKRFVKHAFSKGMVKGLITTTKHLGPRGIVRLLKGYNGQRIHPMVLLAILQAKSQAGGADVIGIEVPRDVLLFTNASLLDDKETKSALIFGREVDIVTGTINTSEVWWEIKSHNKKKGTKDEPSYLDGWHWLKGAREAPSDYDLLKLKGSGTHKQFILDQVAKKLGAIPGKNELSRHDLLKPLTPNIKISSFKWIFHKFRANTKTVKNNNPSLIKIKKKLTKLPVGLTPVSLFKAHTGKTTGPKSVIKLSAIKSFLADVPTELKEAIIEDMQALNYE